MSSIVKIGFCDLVGSTRQQHLVTFDKSKSISDNIEQICTYIQKPKGNYGIKFNNRYITKESVDSINDGALLTLNYSPCYYLDQIFIRDNGFEKTIFIPEFCDLCFDSAFIDAMVETKNHIKLIEEFCKNDLETENITTCVVAIAHFLQRNHMNAINKESLQKVIQLIKNYKECTCDDHIRYALSILQKILYKKNAVFSEFKEKIIQEMDISMIINIISDFSTNPQLHFCLILLVNALVRSCKNEKRKQQIKELNNKRNREIIYRFIIEQESKIDGNIPHELYIYQTFLLSVYEEPLNTFIHLDQVDALKFERHSFAFEDDSENRKSSDLRFSLASMTSECSERSRGASESEFDNTKISLLTKYALDFFRQYYHKEFMEFCTEVEAFNSNIYITCEKITKILCKNLHIGMDPLKKGKLYQPLIFNPNMSSSPFFFEFHSRVIYLFSTTKRQMKARYASDFEKIFNVLDKKVYLVLMKKSKTIKELGNHCAEISYEVVMSNWQKEYNVGMDNVLKTNPAVQELKQQLIFENEKLIYQHRIKIMKEGAHFPLYADKKLIGEFHMRLSSNEKELIYAENIQLKTTTETTYYINDITHVVEGHACIQVKNKLIKEHEKDLAYCIIIKNDIYIHFKAPDDKTAKYWVDGLNLLLNKTQFSGYYHKELEKLVEMDLMLQLIELQNVEIPKTAPPIPKLPKVLKPALLPKPTKIKAKNRLPSSSFC